MHQIDNKGLSNLLGEVMIVESISQKIQMLAKQLDLPIEEIRQSMNTLVADYKRTKLGKNPIEMTPKEFKEAAKYKSAGKVLTSYVVPPSAKVVAESESATVYMLNSFEFAQSLNQYGVRWCIATADSGFLKRYLKDYNFYVLQSKSDKKEIYSIATNKANDKFIDGKYVSVDASNDNIVPSEVLARFNIDPSSILSSKYEEPEFVYDDGEASDALNTIYDAGTSPSYGADIVITALRNGRPADNRLQNLIRYMASPGDDAARANVADIRKGIVKLAAFFIKERKTAYAPLMETLFRRGAHHMPPDYIKAFIPYLIKRDGMEDVITTYRIIGVIPLDDAPVPENGYTMEQVADFIAPLKDADKARMIDTVNNDYNKMGTESENKAPYVRNAKHAQMAKHFFTDREDNYLMGDVIFASLEKGNQFYREIMNPKSSLPNYLNTASAYITTGNRRSPEQLKKITAAIDENEIEAVANELYDYLVSIGDGDKSAKRALARADEVLTYEHKLAVSRALIQKAMAPFKTSQVASPAKLMLSNVFNLPEITEEIKNIVQSEISRVIDDLVSPLGGYNPDLDAHDAQMYAHVLYPYNRAVFKFWPIVVQYFTPELLLKSLMYGEGDWYSLQGEHWAEYKARIFKYLKHELKNVSLDDLDKYSGNAIGAIYPDSLKDEIMVHKLAQ